MRPTKDWTLIRPLDAFGTKGSTLVLPEAYDDDAHGGDGDLIRSYNQTCLAEVVAVGPGRIDSKTGRRGRSDIEPGELVVYNRADAQPTEEEGLLLVREPAILFAVTGNVEQVLGGIDTVADAQ